MKIKTTLAAVSLCVLAFGVNAQSVTTPDGDVVMIEKNQVISPATGPVVTAGPGVATVGAPAVGTTTLVGGLTVGTAVVGGVVAAVVIGVVAGSGT